MTQSKQGEVWSATPSKDSPSWLPNLNEHELDWKEWGKRGGRPAYVLSRHVSVPSALASPRWIVLPICTPKNPKTKPRFTYRYETPTSAPLKSGNIHCGQPFGFDSHAIHTNIYDLNNHFLKALDVLDSYLNASDGRFHSGDLVEIQFAKPELGLVLADSISPLKLVTVVHCYCSSAPEDESDPTILLLKHKCIEFLDRSSLNAFSDVNAADLLLVRTVAYSRILGVLGKMRDNGEELKCKFGRLFWGA